MAEDTKRTDLGVPLATRFIGEWKHILELHDWQINYCLDDSLPPDKFAEVTIQLAEKRAYLNLQSGMSSSLLYDTIGHELLHLVLADLEVVAWSGDRELISLFIERVVCQLERGFKNVQTNDLH